MKTTFKLAASSVTLAVAAFALALPAAATGDDVKCGNTSGEWMSTDAAEAKVAEMGYEVRRVKSEDSCYEVYAVGKDGQMVEIYMNPVTGDIVKTENKS